jgi:ATP diphosphatase
VDPEEALRQANAKFTRRFRHIEARLEQEPEAKGDLATLEAWWVEAKCAEKA